MILDIEIVSNTFIYRCERFRLNQQTLGNSFKLVVIAIPCWELKYCKFLPCYTALRLQQLLLDSFNNFRESYDRLNGTIKALSGY
jgi:hypothetical protein